MSELGQHLKAVREEKGITIEDLQKTTKIQKRYLIAIEEGKFETLPGLFYARAFVKTYAESIGLDPEQLFDQFKNELPNPQKQTEQLPSRTERSKSPSIKNKRKTKSNPLIPAVVTLLFIGAIAAGIWLVVQSLNNADQVEGIPPEDNTDEGLFADDFTDETDENVEEDPTDAENVESEENEDFVDEQEETETSSTLTFNESQGITSFYVLSGGSQFDVELVFNGRSYVDVKNGKGSTFFSGQPPAGEEQSYDFSEEEEIILNLGASGNVDVFINGEKLEYQLEQVHQKVNIKFESGE